MIKRYTGRTTQIFSIFLIRLLHVMMFVNLLFLFRVGLRPILFFRQHRGLFYVSQNPSDQ